jgi:acyl carrier protein
VDIESVILSLSGVARAKVLISRIGTEEPKITAYIVFSNRFEEVRQAAMKKLPDLLPQHMIPHSVVELDVFPELSNGKVDISRLRALDTTERECMQSETDSNSDCVLPQLEHMLCDLLQRQTVNPRVNFLDMGGDSLIATRLLSRIQATFNVDISIEELFQPNATLEKLANVIAQLTR